MRILFKWIKKCSPHHTPYDALYTYVLSEINKLITAKSDPTTLNNLLESNIPDDTSVKKKSLEKLIKREIEIKELIKRVFEQNSLGLMDDDTYHDLYNGYSEEKKRNAEAISKLQDELAKNNSRQIEQMRLRGIIESCMVRCIGRYFQHKGIYDRAARFYGRRFNLDVVVCYSSAAPIV